MISNLFFYEDEEGPGGGSTQIYKLLPCADYMGGFFSEIPLTLGGLYEKIPLKSGQN